MTNQTEHTVESVLDTALNTHPMAELPEGFMSRVMAQVLPQPEPFRIPWSDVVWSLLIALGVGFIMLLMLNMLGQIELGWLPDVSALVQWLDSPWTLRSLGIVSAELVIGLALYVGFWEDSFDLI